jgi:hypothetical protein
MVDFPESPDPNSSTLLHGLASMLTLGSTSTHLNLRGQLLLCLIIYSVVSTKRIAYIQRKISEIECAPLSGTSQLLYVDACPHRTPRRTPLTYSCPSFNRVRYGSFTGIDKKRGYKSKASEPELMGTGSKRADPERRIRGIILIE